MRPGCIHVCMYLCMYGFPFDDDGEGDVFRHVCALDQTYLYACYVCMYVCMYENLVVLSACTRPGLNMLIYMHENLVVLSACMCRGLCKCMCVCVNVREGVGD